MNQEGGVRGGVDEVLFQNEPESGSRSGSFSARLRGTFAPAELALIAGEVVVQDGLIFQDGFAGQQDRLRFSGAPNRRVGRSFAI